MPESWKSGNSAYIASYYPKYPEIDPSSWVKKGMRVIIGPRPETASNAWYVCRAMANGVPDVSQWSLVSESYLIRPERYITFDAKPDPTPTPKDPDMGDRIVIPAATPLSKAEFLSLIDYQAKPGCSESCRNPATWTIEDIRRLHATAARLYPDDEADDSAEPATESKSMVPAEVFRNGDIVLDSRPGTNIDDMAKITVMLANAIGHEVRLKFGGVHLDCRVESDPKDVIRGYWRWVSDDPPKD